MSLFTENPILPPKKKAQIADSSLFWGGGWVTSPCEQIQSLTPAYMGQQGRLFVLHYVDHQLHAEPEAVDEHIPFRD